MALNLSTKKVIVAEVNQVAKTAMAVGVARYSGLTVAEMTELRQLAYRAEVSLKVVKNTLARRALTGTDCACINDVLAGPVLLGFATTDPGAVARVFREFNKENSTLVVVGLGVAGKFAPAEQLDKIADLPTKEQAIGTMMALMRMPLEKLARVLNEVPTKLVRVVLAVSKQK